MSQDPNQRQDAYQGYGDVPQSSNPYGTPTSQTSQQPQQYPYGAQAQPSQPAYYDSLPGYGTQSNHGIPPNYGTPPNYATPPNYQQQNYGVPYNAFNHDQPGYGTPVAFAPLPLGKAIQQLPDQYIKVLTRPSALTFDQEKGKAAWDIVLVQLIILAVGFTFFSFLVSVIFPGSTSQYGVGASLSYIILIPLIFFIGIGPYYLIAKAFKGEGTFLQQCYTALLFSTPIAVIFGVLIFIPILGGIAFLALTIYANVLNVFSIMSVHRLSGGKATAVALIPGVVVGVVAALLFCGLWAVFIAILAAMQHQ
jgi:Yip1 domain